MSTSPVKFVRAAAAAVGGGGNPSQMGALQNIFAAKRENKRQRRAQRAKARADYRKNAAMGYRDRMRAGTAQARSVAAPVDELSSVTPTMEANNSIDNTLTADPTVAPVTTSAVLDPISRQPMGGVQPVPNIQEQTTPEDVATYGVAGAAESMFGTPLQRQMSMGSSLMKRACKYKNKK